MLYEAFMAGVWSSLGSTVGKLSGTHFVVGDSYLIWAGLLVIMMLVNTWGCRCYLRSLDAAKNSVAPTVISSASSYILSGIFGVILFNEAASITWWLGTALIVQGLALVARQQK
ncbi:uncharacterized protein LOC120630409 [Pararge aegeria]|uniref:Jg9140 protein n=2 Tax=Pararge aegeria TaxID=116150 RepID=A0A8S4SMN9_9NEOP|nr:uncharacterized protein LOC120630409 [Pararge aegeria]CAH2266377.1 jg9140 [Pararge aegeria aegeria]